MRRVCVLCVWALLVGAWVSCSSSDPGGDGGPGVDDAAGDRSLKSRGSVVLPTGSSLSLSDLRVVNSETDGEAVDAAGTFPVLYKTGGSVMSVAVDADGDAVLFAFADARGPAVEINALETATGLLFLAIGGYTLPPRNIGEVLGVIRSSEEAASLAVEVEARLSADPKWLVEDDPELVESIAELVEDSRLSAVSRAVGAEPDDRVAAKPIGALIDPPGQNSGVEIQQSPDNEGIVVVNNWRRNCAYFVYKTGYRDAEGDHEIEPTIVGHADYSQANGTFLSSTQAIDGVIGSTIGSIIGNVTFQPVRSRTVVLPVAESEEAAYFDVVVTGGYVPLHHPDSTLAGNRAEWIDSAKKMALLTFCKEIALPLIFNVMIPGKALGDGEVDAADILAFGQQLVVIAPDLVIKIDMGDWRGAINSFVDGLTNNAGVRELVLEFFRRRHGERFSHSTIHAVLNSANNIIAALDIGLAGADILAVAHDMRESNPIERFRVTAIEPEVMLQPPAAQVEPGHSVTFTASAEVDGTKFYTWKTTGYHGHIEDDSGHSSRSSFTTTSNRVRYVADDALPDLAVDVVTVVLEIPDPNGSVADHVVVGAANSTVSGLVTLGIDPRMTVAAGGELVTFRAQTNEQGDLRYEWDATGSLGGTLETASGHLDEPLVTYRVPSVVELGQSASILLDVYLRSDGADSYIGSAVASINGRENDKVMIHGSYGVEIVPENEVASSIIAYLYVPKVQGAVLYDLFAHGFHDELFYGESLTRRWSEAQPGVEDTGGEWRLGLTLYSGHNDSLGGALNTINARFDGIVVDVTVTLGD